MEADSGELHKGKTMNNNQIFKNPLYHCCIVVVFCTVTTILKEHRFSTCILGDSQQKCKLIVLKKCWLIIHLTDR